MAASAFEQTPLDLSSHPEHFQKLHSFIISLLDNVSNFQNTTSHFIPSIDSQEELVERVGALSLDNFDEDKFRNELKAVGILLALEATKFTVAHKPPCSPSDSIATTTKLSKLVIRLLMAIESVPITCGATLKNEHKKCVSEIFLSLANLCNDFLPTEIKVPMSRCFPDFLISTGLVWNACDVFGKLSVHNKVAVSRRVEEALGILNDVIREMEEMVEEASQHVAENDCPNRNDDDKEKDSAADEGEKESSHDEMDDRMFSPNLTHNELQNTKKVLNLFKLTKLLFRKINARVVKLFPIRNYSNSPSASTSSTAESSRVSVSAHQTQPASLDHLVTPLPVLLDLFDELGVSLYSPQTVSTIRSQATKMTRVCIDLCHVCKTLIGEYECEDATEHVSWFETCEEKYKTVLDELLDNIAYHESR